MDLQDLQEDLQDNLGNLVLSCYIYLSIHPEPSRIQLFKAILTVISNYLGPWLSEAEVQLPPVQLG